MAGWIEARRGDSVESIAYRFGHVPDTLWDHPENAPLREARRSMHVLQAGDRVFVPPIGIREEPAAVDRVHRFRRRSVPSVIRFAIVVWGETLADRPCTVRLPGHRDLVTRTDGDGRVEIPLLPVAQEGTIVVERADGELLELAIRPRHLDPVSTVRGVQARLRNLGLYAGAPDGIRDLATVSAIADFQTLEGLTVTGEMDASTEARLLDAHGG